MEEKHQHNDKLKLVIAGILLFIIVSVCFVTGVWVGQERARFSFRWAENYHHNFGGPKMGFMGNFPQEEFINAHGAFGAVIKIDGNVLVIKGQNDVEETVVVTIKTTIRNSSGAVKITDIKAGDNLVVIGSPDAQGQIEAKFIRVMPAGSFMSGKTNTFEERVF